jgi:hypothetical protein
MKARRAAILALATVGLVVGLTAMAGSASASGSSADLAVTHYTWSSRVPVGETQSYLLRVFDKGPATATGINVFIQLPLNQVIVRTGILPGRCWSPTPASVQCRIDQLAPGTGSSDGTTIVIDARVAFVNPLAFSYATVSGDQSDTNWGNNSAGVTMFNG